MLDVQVLTIVVSTLTPIVLTSYVEGNQDEPDVDCIAAVEIIDQKYVSTPTFFIPVVTVWRYRLLQTIKGRCAFSGAIVEVGGKLPDDDTEDSGFITFSGRIQLKTHERFIVQLRNLHRVDSAYHSVPFRPQMQVINRGNSGLFWITGYNVSALALPFRSRLNYGVLTLRIIHLMAQAEHPLSVAQQLQSVPIYDSGQRN